MADTVYVDHGDRVLAAGLNGMGGVSLRMFTPGGFQEISLEPAEMGALIALLQAAVAADSEKRLEDKPSLGTFPGGRDSGATGA